jgi:hypothetical protein
MASGPWWVPGTPITFAGGEPEKAWKQLVVAHVPGAPAETTETGLALEFAVPNSRKQDLDNLAEPVVSVVVNRCGWFGGRRPNLQWLALCKTVARPLGCRISPLAKAPEHWTPARAPIVNEAYLGSAPVSATSSDLAAWLADRCEPGVDRRYAVALRFADRPNLGEVATGKVKPVIDCMWPMLGGSPGNPEDWRIDTLMLSRESPDLPAGAVAITAWAL